jgi:hypothetical protein
VGLNNDGLASVQWQRREFCVFDIETAPIHDAADYIEVGDAPGNYTKQESIDKWKRERFDKLLADAALDLDLLRIVAIGARTELREMPPVCCHAEDTETKALEWFWKLAEGRLLVGFNIKDFDILALLRRSLYLGVETPKMRYTRYSIGEPGEVIDLCDILGFGRIEHKHSLSFYLKRFGIENNDPVRGADIPMLVLQKQWKMIADHVIADVRAEYALAARIGVLPQSRIENRESEAVL